MGFEPKWVRLMFKISSSPITLKKAVALLCDRRGYGFFAFRDAVWRDRSVRRDRLPNRKFPTEHLARFSFDRLEPLSIFTVESLACLLFRKIPSIELPSLSERHCHLEDLEES